MVVEGFRTCLAAYEAAQELKVETPIIDAVLQCNIPTPWS